jgi:peptidylprolyl isomerase
MKRSTKVSVWALMFALLFFVLVACGPAESKEIEATTAPTQESVENESVEAEDSVALPTTTELEYVEIEAGDGPMPETGDRVQVHYTGTLEDGTVFDSSVDGGTPFEFVLGQGQVISGWDQGIALMREGGRATLIIPPELAYGAQGAGGAIPPNATLTFEVELVAVIKPPKPEEIAEGDFESLSSGIQYYDIEIGDDDLLETGDRISAHFAAWIQDGDFLTDSREQGSPAIYTLGANQVFLNDWDEAVIGMGIGGIRQVLIPPEAAGQSASPGQALIIELEVLRKLETFSPVEVDEADYTTTDSGLKYYDIVVGDGDLAEAGFTVNVNYTGWLIDSESQFDSTFDRGEPVEFPFGVGVVIPGWDEGIDGMHVGGRRQLIIPPELGFGEAGSGRVPPNSTLLFEIELLGVTEGP